MPLNSLDPLGALGGLVGGGAIPADATPEAIKRRRAVQAAIAAQKRKFPTTLGEGMTYLGEAVGERMADDRLTEAEKIMAARDKTAPLANVPAVAGVPVSAAPVATPAPAPAAAPAGNTYQGKPYTEVPVRKSEGEGDLKDRLTALLLGGNGAGVPQENPTLAEALPPQEAGGPQQANVQLASLGGAGGTMTDAPPPGAVPRLPPAPVTEPPNPPTPTDIQPMPVKTAQVGAPPAGVLPGSDASMFAPPTFQRMAPRATGGGIDIPPAPEPVPFRDPGPPPQPPRVSKTMAQNLAVANNRMYGDDVRAEAARRYKEEGTARHEVYKQTFDLWKDRATKAEEYRLADPDTRLKLRQAHLNALKTQRELEGEGAIPLTADERKSFGIAPDKPAWKNRRGEVVVKEGGTTVNVGDKATGKGLEEIEKEMATHIVGQWKEGVTAGDDLNTLTTMRALSARVNTGPEAVAKQFLGKLGIKTEGIGPIEAYTSMVNRLAPQQRVPGTGATSDFDAKMFLASIPSLMNTPAGNALIMDTMEQLARNKMARAEIAGKVVSRQLTIPEGTQELLKLQVEARSVSDRVRAHLEATGVKTPEPLIPKAGTVAPPPGAIEELRADPSKAKFFDQTFGEGASRRYLDF